MEQEFKIFLQLINCCSEGRKSLDDGIRSGFCTLWILTGDDPAIYNMEIVPNPIRTDI